MKKTINLLEFFTVLKNSWLVLGIACLLGASGAYIVSDYVMQSQYSATTNILVSQNVSASQAIELGEIETNLRMIQTYRDVIQDQIVLEDAATALNNEYTSDELRNKITVDIQPDSQVFAVTAVDNDPEMAAAIANETAKAFQMNVAEVISIDNVAILSPAISQPAAIYPNIPFNTLLGGAIGILFGMAYSLLKAVADKKIRSETAITEALDWNIIGVISSMQERDIKPSSNIEEWKFSPEVKNK